MNRKEIVCIAVVVSLGLSAGLSKVRAQETPPIPHAFYGKLGIYGPGHPSFIDAPEGVLVEAMVADNVCGDITTENIGKYGGPDPLDNKLVVQGYIDQGATIHFYVNGVEADQTAKFDSGEVTELDLTVEDNVAPVVTIDPVTTPTNVATQTITGTFDEAFIGTIVVNGVEASIDEDAGTYSAADVPLENEGTNEITVTATDLVGNVGTATATIVLDTVKPTISDISASGITSTGATIAWTTDEPATSEVEYGTSEAYGSAESDATLTTSHSITLTGLSAGTTYHYRVKSADAATNMSVSADYTFTTAPPANRPPTADADGPYSVDGGETVELDGTGSSDPDGTIVSYSWAITDDPTGGASLTDSGTATPIFHAPSVDEDTDVTVRLTVTDDDGATDDDSALVTIRVLPPAPSPEEVENMTPEDAAENLVASDPESAARTLENVVVDNVEFAAEIADSAVKRGLTDDMASISNRMSTDKVADLLRAVFDLPETPEVAAELLGAIDLDRSTAVVQTFIAKGWYDYVDGMFAHLSDETLNDIYEELTVDQRGELYPELSPRVKDRISAELAPRFEVSNLAVSKLEVEPGETTTISADVTNTGGTPSTYTVELSIEGEVVDSRDVPLDPGDSETVSFDVAKEEEGTYSVEVDGLTKSFEVKKPPKPFPWTTVIAIIVIIAAIIVVGAWYWTRGRRTGGL